MENEFIGLKKALSEAQLVLCSETMEKIVPKVLQVDLERNVPGVRVAQQAAGQLIKRVVRMALTGDTIVDQEVLSIVSDTYRQAIPR